MTSVVAVLVGGVLGALVLDEFGRNFIIGALFGYLLAQVWRLHAQVRALTGPAAPAPAVAMPAPPAHASAPVEEPPPPDPVPVSATVDAAPPSPTRPAPEAAYDDALLRTARRIQHFFTGGNALVRVGVVVLFFGVAFLLKYAAEHSRLPIELRLAGTALGAIVLLGIGWRLRHTRAAYGLALEGGAIGILYLTIFAALRLYELLPASLAFALLVAIVVCATLLALLQDSLALAVLSVAGGFLAPVLASTGSGDHVGLFAYYVVLSAGILAVAWYKSWRLLNLVGFGFTFVIAAAWGWRYYQPAYFASTEPFLILFFLFYVAIAVLHGLRQPPQLKGYVDGTLVFGVPIVGFALQAGLVREFEFGLAVSALALAAFYIALAWLLWRRARATLRTLTEAFLALGVVFLTLAIPLAVDGRWTAAAWALEGAGILWVGVRQHRLLPRLFGAALQVGAGLMFAAAVHRSGTPFLNAGFFGAVLVALSGLFSAYLLDQQRARLRAWERAVGLALFVWGALWWLIGNVAEIERLHRPQTLALMVLFLAASAAVFEILGARRTWRDARVATVALLPALVFLAAGLFVSPHTHPFAHGGVLAWPLALAVHYWTLHRQENAPGLARAARHTVALWLLVFLAAWELHWAVQGTLGGGADWAFSAWALVPALALLALREHTRWPLRDRARTYLTWAAGGLAAALAAWLLAASIGRAGDSAPLPYVPLLNPVDLVSAAALLAGYAWLRRARSFIDATAALHAMLGALAFLWLNAVLFRTLHHVAGVPYTLRAMLDSLLVQSALSLFWTVLALILMTVATRVHRRRLWLIGAGLLAVVVLKLFLIDLAGSGTVTRIVSFLGVGVLMLVMGYAAPVPPRTEELEEFTEARP